MRSTTDDDLRPKAGSEALAARTSRRAALRLAGALASLGAVAGPRGAVRAAMGPDDKFDLVVKGAEVIDPANKLRGIRDIGIRHGRIESVAEAIDATRAQRVLAVPGKLVVPGLIDLHAHVYPYGSAIGIAPDELHRRQGTTTAVSAGDGGANNFAGFRRLIVASSRTRLFAFVHIANHGLAGFPVPELYNIDFANVELAARTLAENSDIALGIKVRMSENVVARHGLEPLKRAIRACEMAGSGRVMSHIGGVESVELMTAILDLLRPGDILTHCYSGAPNLNGQFTNIVQGGKLLPAALAAKQRGVLFDVGHGGGSFDYTVAEPAIAQGAGPDVISSDIHVHSGNTPGMPYLTWVMSKFLGLGFAIDDVVAMATVRPAAVIDRIKGLGTLGVGAPADITVLDRVEGPVEFVDTRNNRRTGSVHLLPVTTVVGGIVDGRPYAAPFAPR
jgi:dihydroorotase